MELVGKKVARGRGEGKVGCRGGVEKRVRERQGKGRGGVE